jgi:GNAT superfamily N-acetyltransferase
MSTDILALGYENEELATSWGYLLCLHDATKIMLKTDISSTLSKETVDNYQNFLICDLKRKILSGCLAAVVAEDGKILSAAVTHLPLEEIGDGLAEITVQTHPSARSRGYASACVAKLSEELLSLGFSVLYRARSENAASLAVAKKVGFVPYAQFYRFVGRRK